MPTVGSVGGVTLVIWPFDHEPPHIDAHEGTPNTPDARQSRFAIETGNLIDRPSAAALPTAKVRQVQRWIAAHRHELERRWQSLQP
ncbi:MAG: DUF4160 domain-containing protein [Solirubrobacteraceae bacterium]